VIGFFLRLVSARLLASLTSLLTISLGVSALPSDQYASFAIAVAYSAIVVTVVFLPFSKFVLLEGNAPGLTQRFLRLQAVLATVAAGLVVGAGSIQEERISGYVMLSGMVIFLGTAQGMKDYSGELARSAGDLKSAQLIYLLDAIITLLLSCLALAAWTRYEPFLLASVASSLAVSVCFLRRFKFTDSRRSAPVTVMGVIERSTGLLVSGGIASFATAIGRSALVAVSPPQIAGFVQYLVDVMQRVAALWSSTLLSAALPFARRNGVRESIPAVRGVMLIALPILGGVVGVLLLIGERVTLKSVAGVELSGALATSLVVLVWAARYRSTVIEMPALVSERTKWAPISGATATLLLTLLALNFRLSLSWAAVALASCHVAGGALTAYLANRLVPQDTRNQLLSVGVAIGVLATSAVLIYAWGRD